VKRIYVIHDDAADLGLRAPQFATRADAEAKRDEWNKEIPGHKVLEIEEGDTANAPREGRAVARTLHADVGATIQQEEKL
jgi:hypothetical protein